MLMKENIKQIIDSYSGINFDSRYGVYIMDMPFDNRDIYNADEWIKDEVFDGRGDEIESVEDFRNIVMECLYEGYEQVEGDLIEELVEYVMNELVNDMDINDKANDFNGYNKIRNEVRDFIDVNVEVSYKKMFSALMNNVRLNCFVALTGTNGEMNYDFGETGYRILGKNGKMISFNEFEKLHNSYKFLCRTQGVDFRDLYGALQNRMFGNGDGDGDENGFVETLAREIQESYNGGAFVFLAELPINKIAEIKWGGKDIVINKNCFCGIYDWVDGEGGTLEVDLEKNVVVKNGEFELFIDGEMGYSIDQCYGLTSKAWKYGKIDVMNGDFLKGDDGDGDGINESVDSNLRGVNNEERSEFINDLRTLERRFARDIENIYSKCETEDDYLMVIKNINKIMKNEIYNIYDYAMKRRTIDNRSFVSMIEKVIDELPII